MPIKDDLELTEYIPNPDDCSVCGGNGEEFVGYSDNNGEAIFRPCTVCKGSGKRKVD